MGDFLRLPACQSLSLWEQRRRPPPVAETGRSCWGSVQQDASGSEADAGSRNPGSVTEGDGEGKPGTKEPLRSDKQLFCQSDIIAVSELFGSGLALSGAPRQFPQRGSHWTTGRLRLSTTSQSASLDKARLRLPASAALSLLRQRPCPLRRSAPAPPKGEPLAGRATSYWTPEARYGVKGRALLQRAAASGQAHLVKLPLA